MTDQEKSRRSASCRTALSTAVFDRREPGVFDIQSERIVPNARPTHAQPLPAQHAQPYSNRVGRAVSNQVPNPWSGTYRPAPMTSRLRCFDARPKLSTLITPAANRRRIAPSRSCLLSPASLASASRLKTAGA